MDEVSFGPKGEAWPSARHRRAFALGAAGTIAAGVVVAVLATGLHYAAASPDTPGRPTAHQAAQAAVGDWLPVICSPVHVVRPSLAGLPAGLRPGALQVITQASFAGTCVVARPSATAG
jgi:hypothetical protein